MSDCIYRIFPDKYSYYPTNTAAIDGAVRLLKMYIIADSITWEGYDNPVFVDCGSNFESVACPFCGHVIDTEIWQEMMDKSYEESNFQDLSIYLSCCDRSSTLNDLKYNMECGFARFVIDIVNPEFPPYKHDLFEVSKPFGKDVSFRMVVTHY